MERSSNKDARFQMSAGLRLLREFVSQVHPDIQNNEEFMLNTVLTTWPFYSTKADH